VEDFAIKVENVSKTFRLPHEKTSSVKSLFINFYRRRRSYEIQKALDDVSLYIKKGEFFGIVGRNGSGKSTLLKLLAGIYTPTQGQVHVHGSLTPFIELGVGFNPDLTGRENVYLNGALLGFNRKEMQAMYKDIVDFAELKKFMDQKLKNYSSGMQVRLAFSIAIRAQSDILLIDEVLAVGDSAFQRKCYDYFNEVKNQNKTVILVSHDMDAVNRFCTRAALITGGELTYVGAPKQVAEYYDKQNAVDKKVLGEKPLVKSGAEIKSLKIIDKKNSYSAKDEIVIKSIVKAEKSITPHIALQIINNSGALVAGVSSMHQLSPTELKASQSQTWEFSFKCDQLSDGEYTVEGVIFNIGDNEPIFYQTALENFIVKDSEQGWGAFNLQGKWRLSDK
jgi:ABC-2 type transport system ATP-binding protein